jgi:peptidyl-prolyl cis-trans isomerase SurA
MEPAIREYLTKMREEAYIQIRPGFTDSGASPRQTTPVYSAYVPPAPKKKKKVERTRYRETTHTFRQKSKPAASEEAAPAPAPAPAKKGKKKAEPVNLATMKPGKKEKIRFGKAPSQTLPGTNETKTEDAGAVPAAANAASEPANPLEANARQAKTRFSSRAKVEKQAKAKAKGAKQDQMTPAPPDAAEVADRQAQAAPLGLAGDTATKKKKKASTTGDKTRLSDKKKEVAPQQGDVPLAPAPQPPPAPGPQPKQ